MVVEHRILPAFRSACAWQSLGATHGMFRIRCTWVDMDTLFGMI